MNLKHLDIFQYDTDLLPFKRTLENIYGYTLELLHELHHYELLSREKDQSTIFHTTYYDNFSTIKPLYHKLLKEVIYPLLNESLVYQKIPTIRIGLPNNVWVGEYHKDSWYGHPSTEYDFVVPFTDMFGTKSLYIETEPDKSDFKSQSVRYGEILYFDHINCKHGKLIGI